MATILVVDDHPVNRDYLLRLLRHSGHRLLEATDGEQALQVAQAEQPNLIITDILMPKMDGYQFVHRLRMEPNNPRIPVIFCTAAYEVQEVRPLAEACGVQHILSKPALPRTVLNLVETVLGRATVPSGPPISSGDFDREHSRVLTNKLSQYVRELEATNLRLVTLMELGQQVSVETDVLALLNKFCLGARLTLGAKYAAVCILTDDRQAVRHFVTNGLDPALAARVQPPSIRNGLLARLFGDHAPLNLRNPSASGANLGFSPHHPVMRSFVGTQIRSGDRTYGLIYLADKQGTEWFSKEDEEVVATIASQLAVVYENAWRLDALRAEVAERRRAEEHIRTLNAELEQRVRERTAELQRSNTDLEQFANVASHDLQEPLRKIAGFATLLAELYHGQLSTEADEFIGYITGGVDRMQRLIRDLLAYARVSRENMAPASTDCEAILTLALANLQVAIDESGACITHDPLPVLVVDQGQLLQLFQNLIGNAVKFHGAEPPRVHVAASRIDDSWLFSIRDNGIGLEPESAERIFVIFQRLHTRAEYPGTGIGLAICKKVVERQGGRIWVESKPGRGSTFYFTLPVRQEPLEGVRS